MRVRARAAFSNSEWLITCRDSIGLVGPIRESAPLMTESLPECEAGCDIGGLGDMVDFVRQWAQVRRALHRAAHVR